ncbi:uncharacterized protein FIESC28_03243 [Fusarium coffeatum]|uniref:Uncharacterized protein n=1 Tax=Fusarium coffeatum TaxID=231269 RepID=A0A366S3P3_9HYPO|nr:uncharacterized protein FIESC28_03243 [Fusarium coffeatum]RBR23933.1 hypothetical protein FIESC28_03243 [Fusarium coffeatum]
MDSSNKRKLGELYPIENPSRPDKMDVDEPTQMICLKLFLLVVAQMSKEQATPQRISNVDATQVLTHLDCLSVVTRKMISTVDSLEETVRQIDGIMKDRAGQLATILSRVRMGCDEIMEACQQRVNYLDDLC